MIFTLYNIVFVVSIFTFVQRTYALWQTAPDVPPDNIRKNCIGWLEHHGFTDDPTQNQIDARYRERQYDPDVYIYAALYASYITAFIQYHPNEPSEFCYRHRRYDEITEPYTTLKDIRKTCVGWITLYGFISDIPGNTWNDVSKRWQPEDKYMAIWAAIYAQYIRINKRRASTTREEFCRGMGFTNNRQTMPFVSMNATLKTCYGWLIFAGFKDDLQHNLNKVARQTKDYEIHMNEFVQEYSEELRKLQIKIAFRFSLQTDPEYTITKKWSETSDNTTSDYMKPEEFCDSLGARGAEERHYKPMYLQ